MTERTSTSHGAGLSMSSCATSASNAWAASRLGMTPECCTRRTRPAAGHVLEQGRPVADRHGEVGYHHVVVVRLEQPQRLCGVDGVGDAGLGSERARQRPSQQQLVIHGQHARRAPGAPTPEGLRLPVQRERGARLRRSPPAAAQPGPHVAASGRGHHLLEEADRPPGGGLLRAGRHGPVHAEAASSSLRSSIAEVSRSNSPGRQFRERMSDSRGSLTTFRSGRTAAPQWLRARPVLRGGAIAPGPAPGVN